MGKVINVNFMVGKRVDNQKVATELTIGNFDALRGLTGYNMQHIELYAKYLMYLYNTRIKEPN